MTKEKSATISKIIGLYQIIGGCIGILITLYAIVNNIQFNISFILYSLLSLTLFSFCLFAGTHCYKLKSVGYSLSFYNQFLQFIFFIIPGFSYLYNPGFGVFLGLEFSDSIHFMYTFKLVAFGFGKTDQKQIVFLVNIAPIIIALVIDEIRKSKQLNPID